MFRRIDKLGELGATMIHLSGGEPLLHPEVDKIIARIRKTGALAGTITNGFLLGPRIINRLNEAGLDHLQISIDNLKPDEVSMKSLKTQDRKLQALAEHADFQVNINSVVGNYMKNPEDAIQIAGRAEALGFTGTVGIIHDGDGQLRPLDERPKQVYHEVKELSKSVFSFATHNNFQENMVKGLPNDWHCRAGSRYIYVCEDGLVHYCSQQRGTPGTPLSEYTLEDLEEAYQAVKGCAPYCTVGCVHRISWLDDLREAPLAALQKMFPSTNGDWSRRDLPVPVRILAWMFIPRNGGKPGMFSRVAERLLRAR
jgi:MoaA/NifB/PqqE/SkfB family radical SAM enzyme